jgi:hypothetical protein
MILAACAAITTVCAGCASVSYERQFVHDDLVLTARSAKQFYEAGEEINVEIWVTNDGTSTAMIPGPSASSGIGECVLVLKQLEGGTPGVETKHCVEPKWSSTLIRLTPGARVKLLSASWKAGPLRVTDVVLAFGGQEYSLGVSTPHVDR